MQRLHNRNFMNAKRSFSMHIACISSVVLMIFLVSCSSFSPAYHETPLVEESTLSSRYSIVFIIHGDGDYIYHDTRGNALRADEEALAGAIRVAARNPQADVFIFHQKPRRHALLFYPLRDGVFYYYRHGRLITKESYWRDQGQSRFDPELELLGKYRQESGTPYRAEDQPELVRLFLYFGHEIPEINGLGYDASYRERTFTVEDLAEELNNITRDSTKFDLIVLSTCFGGTPHTIAALAPYARTVVASPDNLHLSYFDLQPFERLDLGLRDGDVPAFAKNFAHQAFVRLTEDIQTAITVAVYDVNRVQGYLNSVDSVYNHTLTTLKGQPRMSVEHCDCAEDPAYNLPGMSEGVDVFYRPAGFGRLKQKHNHSGWECYRLLK